MARNSRSEGDGERRPSGRPGSPRARLFLALEPRAEDREALAAWRDAVVEGRDDLRPMAADSLHLTLARVKRGRRAAPLEPSEAAPGPLRAPFVTLYRSLLRPQGALYVPLERIELRETVVDPDSI